MPKLGLTGQVAVELEAKKEAARGRLSRSNSVSSEAQSVGSSEEAEKDLRAAFAVFDQDHDGFITRDEMKQAMELMGEQLTDADLDKLLALTDTDLDGQINYEEFIRMLL